MASQWKKGGKTPADLVKNTLSALSSLEKANGTSRTEAKVAKQLNYLKSAVCGDDGIPSPAVIEGVLEAALSGDMISAFIGDLKQLSFDTKKSFTQIFHVLIKTEGPGKRLPMVEYLVKNQKIIDVLCAGYNEPEIVLTCGTLLRECIAFEPLAKYILYSDNFLKFFSYVVDENFDTSSDSFLTFKELLTKHKPIVAAFLEKQYDIFFEEYTKLLNSSNYVTKRQSLKLLGELLLDRANFSVMTRYIGDRENLKLMMNLLRNKMRSIQFEAFHVFKVFVANPNKKPEILKILILNRDKLIKFLTNFQNDKAKEDEQFHDEKEFLLKQIRSLEPL